MGETCQRCRDPRAGRRYTSRSRYRCTGERIVYVTPDGASAAFDPCDAVYIDEAEAAAEAAEEKARREARETAEAMSAGRATNEYCRCGTVAIRRCTSCGTVTCNDQGRCSFLRDERWVCKPCSQRIDDEKRRREEAEQRRKEAAYNALPRLTEDELAAYLSGQGIQIKDGVTHRLDEVTGRFLATAFARAHSAPVAVRWEKTGSSPREQLVLCADGEIVNVSTWKVTRYGMNDSTYEGIDTLVLSKAKPETQYAFRNGAPSELLGLTVEKLPDSSPFAGYSAYKARPPAEKVNTSSRPVGPVSTSDPTFGRGTLLFIAALAFLVVICVYGHSFYVSYLAHYL